MRFDRATMEPTVGLEPESGLAAVEQPAATAATSRDQ
jgi:hypothetical protein